MNFNFIFVIVIYFVNFVCAMPQISDSNAERKNTREDMLIGLFNRISGDDFVENQKKMLIENACPFLTDPSKCESDVELYWNLFSEGLFEEKSAIEFCEYPENDCQKERDWNCKTCLADIKHVADAYRSNEAFEAIIEGFQEGFCNNTESEEEDLTECYTVIEEFIPKALQIVYSDLEENGQKSCYEVFDICDLPKDTEDSSVLTRGESISGLYETLRNKGYYKVLQEDILKKNVCPKLSDPTECQSNINKFWRYMTEGLFSDETATGLCTALIPYGVNCDAEREWNCNVCKSDVKVIADAMRANETADKFLPIFQVGFCENEELNLNEKEIPECKDFIAELIPPALQEIFSNLVDHDQVACQKAFDLCTDDIPLDPSNKEDSIRGIYETLSSDEYFKNQETILINSVCDTLADPEKCENEVKVYWKYIAPGLFGPEAAKEYCAEPEINCTAQTGREWNCDLCQFDVEEIAFAYKSQEAVDYIVQAYQVGFCENEDLNLPEEEIPKCKEDMADFMPKAIDVLYSGTEENWQQICYDAFNVCR